MSGFIKLGVNASIQKALNEMGYTTPTTVQEKVIPLALEGHDLIVLSKTGSGKTAAFSIPMISKEGIFGLILTPTRELAVQVEKEIKSIAKYSGLSTTVIYGGHSMENEKTRLKKGVDLVVGTPGRVLDHMEEGSLRADKINLVVLDEADRMLDMGFIVQVDKILSRTDNRQNTYLFSATLPDQIEKLSQKYQKTPVYVSLETDSKTVDAIAQFYHRVSSKKKRSSLLNVIGANKPESCIIFCNTRNEVDNVYNFLSDRGVTARAIHGANSQSNRIKFLEQFKKGKYNILIATDVAARGLHIDDLELVINYDIPFEKEQYVHRIGRTGRAGKTGKAITLVGDGELYSLYEIEEYVGTYIEETPLPTDEEAESFIKKLQTYSDLYGVSYKEYGRKFSSYEKKSEYGRKSSNHEQKSEYARKISNHEEKSKERK